MSFDIRGDGAVAEMDSEEETRPPPGSGDAPAANGEDDRTRPPAETLRFDTPLDLYAAMPQVAELTQQRPRDGEDVIGYLHRLRASTTPEEAVTFTAFAVVPKIAIWWGTIVYGRCPRRWIKPTMP